MNKLVQLQAALREIERGQRLEAVDGVLVQQVLLQRRALPQKATLEPDPKELYRELLALRQTKAKHSIEKINVDRNGNKARPPKNLTPKKSTSVNRTMDRCLGSSPSSPERIAFSNHGTTIAEKLATTEKIKLMQEALLAREKEFRRSEKAVARADAELREELLHAEKLLPSKFLFERNLAGDRTLEAARNVLVRFQHRFYKLYFGHWWEITLQSRLQVQRRAVAKFVCVYRGHRARREARGLRKELDALQAQKRQLLDFRIKYRSSQAVKLQMVWCRYLRNRAIMHRQARQAAATRLQRAFRMRQWRNQSLVTALTNTRKLFAAVCLQKLYRGHRTRHQLAESRQRQRQEERVQLALLRSMSKQSRAVWMIERRGAGFLIAHQAIFPYAMRLRWHRLHGQLRRQRAAKYISRAVCNWFGVESRREAVRVKQMNEWLALVLREHNRSRSAAILIQKHLRRWVQQRKFLMAEARRKKLARRTRLAQKDRRTKETHFKNLGVLSSPVKIRAARVTQTPGASPQPARIISLIKQRYDISEAARKTEPAAAVVLQCCYRHYRTRKRTRLRTWRTKAHKVEMRVLQRHKAATEIQRRVRGIHGRKLAQRRHAERLLLRFVLRWKWRRIQKRQRAARKLGRWLKHKRTQRLAKLWRVEKQKREAASTRVVLWYRLRCMLPSQLKRVVHFVRRRDETFVFCDQSLQLCRQHMSDEFVAQSFRASLEDALRPLLSDVTTSRSPTKLKASPTKHKIVSSGKHSSSTVKFPILQMVFLVASGWKIPLIWRELDGKTIFQTKLERAKAVTFFRSLSKRGKPVAHQLRHAPPVETASVASSQIRRNQKPAVKWAKGATGVETFSSVDVDVAVARATGGAKGALDFAAFVRVLGLLGEISLTQQSQDSYWGRFDGTEARVLALSWFSVLPHPTIQLLALQFEAFIEEELSRHASCLQRLFTRQHNKLQGAAVLLEMKRNLHNQELSRAAVVLQTEARKFLARRELRRRMQDTYEKFLDPTWGLPYWMNPRTDYSTWLKPRALGAEDVRCEPVPFPPPERTLKPTCNGKMNCDRCAEWVCYDCDEFFCLQCFGEYHKSKIISRDDNFESSRRVDAQDDKHSPIKQEHELEQLVLCGLCKFQLASRRCLDCIPKPEFKPKSKTIQPLSTKLRNQRGKKAIESSDNPEDEHNDSESLFCDVCFGFLHRRGGLKNHHTEPLLEFCTSCIADTEDDNLTASQQQSRKDFGTPGTGNAVQWACEVCGDPPLRICGSCALHSHPKESCGELHPVPLQTLRRQQRTKRLQEEQEARDRADLDKIRARALQARRERSARKIQGFWRSQCPIRRARRLVAARRKDKCDQWLRRQEDARLEKRFAYRAKNALGVATPLGSDTPVERRLRSLHVLARRRLSIRARFFGLLIDEYVTVGIPLPGIGLLHPGSNEIWTSEDLRGWIHNRQTLRFKKLSSQESQPAERALCAWRQLERWGKGDVGLLTMEKDFGSKPESSTDEDTDSIWLADVHPKQTVSESVVPLAQLYNPSLPPKKLRKAGEEDVVEDVPVAMFLVEFSLDPKRTVWINHSLAERFWEWKRLKMLARSERTAQRQRAKDYEKQRKEREDKQKQEEELKNQEDTINGIDTQIPVADVDASASNVASVEQSWLAPISTWATNETTADSYYDYNYYPPANGADTTASWTGYDGHSTKYSTDYDYSYESVALASPPALAGELAGLVDSGSYYTNGDYTGGSNGSSAVNWYGTEYNSYVADGSSVPIDYTNNVNVNDYSGWESYASSVYAETQPLYDPNTAYNGDGDPNYINNSADQWQQSHYTLDTVQAQPPDSYPSGTNSSPYDATGSSYTIDLSAEGEAEFYPDDQIHSNLEPASTHWEEVYDPSTQQTYYINRLTNETAWQIPQLK